MVGDSVYRDGSGKSGGEGGERRAQKGVEEEALGLLCLQASAISFAKMCSSASLVSYDERPKAPGGQVLSERGGEPEGRRGRGVREKGAEDQGVLAGEQVSFRVRHPPWWRKNRVEE